ncbi:TetR/AcrR family transcriptional regulator [Aldersonia kunmingensis]|uniref:TetR/AcrR family transcriptional regulator n=1 Tax=Aldersonia kunmingensis TaxID=408066 RepID=UPI000831B6D4|nr:TetR/AcrR family transcriptional regulator [Aldersonia kunmingensis]
MTAAQQHFGDRGYFGARLVDIAADAGVTHSSIYQYFSSKEDLYQAAFEAAQAELLPEYLAAVQSETSLRGQIGAILRASADVHRRNPLITPFLASMPLEVRRHPDLLGGLQDVGEPLMAALHEMFESARASGEIPSNVADLDLMIAFIGSAMGIGLLSYGLRTESMDAAAGVIARVMFGDFFRD